MRPARNTFQTCRRIATPVELVSVTLSSASETDTFTLDLPEEREAGDLLVYAAFKSGSVSGITQTSGWSLPAPGSPGGTSGSIGAACRYRVLTGAEADTIELVTSGSAGNWSGVLWQVRGHSGVPNAAGEGNPTSGTVTAPGLTFNGALWLVAAGLASNTPTTAPPGFGGFAAEGTGPIVAFAHREIRAPGMPAGAFSVDADNYRSITIGIASA